MITVIAYVLLHKVSGNDWSGWLMVLPVLLDLALIDFVEKWWKR